jgi:hypothetical protein
MIQYSNPRPPLEQSLGYLKRRVAEEAAAAISATSIEVRLIHIAFATAYAKRVRESSALGRRASVAWVDEHRVW